MLHDRTLMPSSTSILAHQAAFVRVALLMLLLCGSAQGQSMINVPPQSAPTEIYGPAVLNLLDGGVLPWNFQVYAGATLNIQGGYVEGRLLAQSGSMVKITGGVIGAGGTTDGRSLLPQDGATIYVSGGAIGDSFLAESGVNVTFEGSDFRLNGKPIGGLERAGDSMLFALDLADDNYNYPHRVFSGIFADGTPFVFTGYEYDSFSNDIKLIRSTDLPAYPSEIEVIDSSSPKGALPGQFVKVLSNGSLPLNFVAAHGSRIEVIGGTIGENFEADGAEVFITSATIGSYFDALQGAYVSIADSTIEGDFEVRYETKLRIVDSRAARFKARHGSQVALEGGSFAELDIRESSLEFRGASLTGTLTLIESAAQIDSGQFSRETRMDESAMTVAGGNILDRQLVVRNQSQVTLVGHEFSLDGQPLDNAFLDNSIVVTARNGALLTGMLKDGTHFETNLYSFGPGRPTLQEMYLSADSVLQLTFVPEPTPLLMLFVGIALLVSVRCRWSGQRTVRIEA